MELQTAFFTFLRAVEPVWEVMSYPVGPLFIFFTLQIFAFRGPKRWRTLILILSGILGGAAIFGIDKLLYLLGIVSPNLDYLRISLISAVVIIAGAVSLYRGDKALIALTALLLYNVFSAVRFLFMGIFRYSFPRLEIMSLIRAGTFFSAAVSAVLCVFILRFQKNAVSGLSQRESILWFAVALFTMIAMCIQSSFSWELWRDVLSAIDLLLTTLAIYCLIFLYSNQKFIAAEQRKILSNMDKYEGYLEQLKELDTHISMTRHEVKNHVFYIDQLLKSGDYDQLREYVNKLKEDDLAPVVVVSTGNRVVDSIVNQKCAYAQSLGIGVEVTAALGEELRIDDLSLCSVLGNLLSNAIEGSSGVEHACISLDIRMFKGYFVVTARNFVSSNVIKENPHLLTTKKDAEKHGFGLKVVEQVADWYEGSLRLEMADKRTFSASVMLKNAPLSEVGQH